MNVESRYRIAPDPNFTRKPTLSPSPYDHVAKLSHRLALDESYRMPFIKHSYKQAAVQYAVLAIVLVALRHWHYYDHINFYTFLWLLIVGLVRMYMMWSRKVWYFVVDAVCLQLSIDTFVDMDSICTWTREKISVVEHEYVDTVSVIRLVLKNRKSGKLRTIKLPIAAKESSLELVDFISALQSHSK